MSSSPSVFGLRTRVTFLSSFHLSDEMVTRYWVGAVFVTQLKAARKDKQFEVTKLEEESALVQELKSLGLSEEALDAILAGHQIPSNPQT